MSIHTNEDHTGQACANLTGVFDASMSFSGSVEENTLEQVESENEMDVSTQSERLKEFHRISDIRTLQGQHADIVQGLLEEIQSSEIELTEAKSELRALKDFKWHDKEEIKFAKDRIDCTEACLEYKKDKLKILEDILPHIYELTLPMVTECGLIKVQYLPHASSHLACSAYMMQKWYIIDRKRYITQDILYVLSGGVDFKEFENSEAIAGKQIHQTLLEAISAFLRSSNETLELCHQHLSSPFLMMENNSRLPCTNPPARIFDVLIPDIGPHPIGRCYLTKELSINGIAFHKQARYKISLNIPNDVEFMQTCHKKSKFTGEKSLEVVETTYSLEGAKRHYLAEEPTAEDIDRIRKLTFHAVNRVLVLAHRMMKKKRSMNIS